MGMLTVRVLRVSYIVVSVLQWDVSIKEMLEFRKAVEKIDAGYPFSVTFGPCDSRENCVKSSQQVYERLMHASPDQDHLHFETIATLAITDDENVDHSKLRALIKLFRPDREGGLTRLDFVKSIDTGMMLLRRRKVVHEVSTCTLTKSLFSAASSVYKELRVLRAAAKNAMQVVFSIKENVVNFAFYSVMLLLFIAVCGFNPVAFVLSVSGLLVGFSFMIGSASADYFKGLLLIILRRPYDVGGVCVMYIFCCLVLRRA